jgi:hypothetical protein
MQEYTFIEKTQTIESVSNICAYCKNEKGEPKTNNKAILYNENPERPKANIGNVRGTEVYISIPRCFNCNENQEINSMKNSVVNILLGTLIGIAFGFFYKMSVGIFSFDFSSGEIQLFSPLIVLCSSVAYYLGKKSRIEKTFGQLPLVKDLRKQNWSLKYEK